VASGVLPTISNFEIRILFEALDKSKDKSIDYDEFKDLILENDFRDTIDIASRVQSSFILVHLRAYSD
jgi:hypothetical protein